MKILKFYSKNRKEAKEAVKEIARIIKQEKAIICPTDTVYGLLADASSKKAVDKVFKIKKRNKNKPVPIFVKDIKMAKKIADIGKEQEKFLKMAWPTRPNFKKGPQKKMVEIAPKIWADKGKITAVLKRKKSKIKIYGIDKKTIALRIPNYELIMELLKKTNKPLTGTSANISGRPAPVKIKEALKQFTLQRGSRREKQKYQPDLVVDAGNLPKNKPSAIIDLTTLPPKILRK